MNVLPQELLEEELSRVKLLSLPQPGNLQRLDIAVHRNHAFEPVASVMNVFLASSGLSAHFHYSDYDDSLNFTQPQTHRDAHIIWLDTSRYGLRDVSAWLEERLAALYALDSAPILVCCLGQDIRLQSAPSRLVCDMGAVLGGLGAGAEDRRLEPFSGTRLSNRACLECARWLGLRLLPALFRPALKALALDCDNTLYDGVLAEDGPDGVRPYVEVQQYLLELSRQGFLLTLVSRNEETDVRMLFARRGDFPLHWEDFAATAINWQAKSENIVSVAEKLNIGVDAVAFVDDNWGELTEVSLALPQVRLLSASSPQATLRGLRFCPLLWKPDVLPEDSLRRADVQANETRARLQSTYSPLEYRRKLGICLTFAVNPVQRADRVTELLNKTNQFIFTFLRPSAQDVQDYMQREDRVCVVCHMRDMLSDSGLIAIVLAARCGQSGQEGSLRVDELAVSCRALGRGMETGMIFALLARACTALGCKRLRLAWKTGPRNMPGIAWLREHWPGEVGPCLATADATLLTGHLEGVHVQDVGKSEITTGQASTKTMRQEEAPAWASL